MLVALCTEYIRSLCVFLFSLLRTGFYNIFQRPVLCFVCMSVLAMPIIPPVCLLHYMFCSILKYCLVGTFPVWQSSILRSVSWYLCCMCLSSSSCSVSGCGEFLSICFVSLIVSSITFSCLNLSLY